MRSRAWLGAATLVVACGGGRDAWTQADGAPPDDLRAALAGPAPMASTTTSAPALVAGPARDLGPDDLSCSAPWRCTPHPRWTGQRPAAVKAKLGKPFFESASEWHYMVQREGCRAPSQRLVFHWPEGSVHFKWSRADLSCFADLKLPERNDRLGLEGLRGAEAPSVLAALGVPDYAEDGQWVYRVPDGCAEERDVTTVVWQGEKVRSVHREHVHTGEHCEPVSL